MENISVCKVFAKLSELSTGNKPVDFSTLRKELNTNEMLIKEYVSALEILGLVKSDESNVSLTLGTGAYGM
jgi:hypothetical protein